jgi:hypothetical protein
MANAIMKVLCEFGLAEKTLALTTDNASSMISCGEIILEELEEEFQNLNFAHYRCAAHVLNLAVNNGLILISESVKKVRCLMSYIKSSQPVRDSLKMLCEVKGIDYLAPELDVNTRWNSTFYMLEKWKRMEPALNLLAADDSNVRRRYPANIDRVNIDVSEIFILLALILPLHPRYPVTSPLHPRYIPVTSPLHPRYIPVTFPLHSRYIPVTFMEARTSSPLPSPE